MQEALVTAPREQLIAVMKQLRLAAHFNLESFNDEHERAEEWRHQAEVFKDLYDRAMNCLERLGGSELPELLKLRHDAEVFLSGQRRGVENASARHKARRERFRNEIGETIRAKEKLDALVATHAARREAAKAACEPSGASPKATKQAMDDAGLSRSTIYVVAGELVGSSKKRSTT